jgi:uncharacterized protein YlxW (UPF0749 family)
MFWSDLNKLKETISSAATSIQSQASVAAQSYIASTEDTQLRRQVTEPKKDRLFELQCLVESQQKELAQLHSERNDLRQRVLLHTDQLRDITSRLSRAGPLDLISSSHQDHLEELAQL